MCFNNDICSFKVLTLFLFRPNTNPFYNNVTVKCEIALIVSSEMTTALPPPFPIIPYISNHF